MALPIIAAFAALLPSVVVTDAVVAPRNAFLLDVTYQGVTRSVNLNCRPDGGTHPRHMEACADLSRVNGRIERLGGQGVMCTMEYDPVSVLARGEWRGQRRSFQETFPNRCVTYAESARVFAFFE
ncbi:hypothetical protein GCM10022243_08620 [Saccharothrix violaceirubra]|uniref:Subtilisin inhibitor domain-containing protein n=1 Tax=Saccharothrix violaceirubra TaxID=413306 RepID=A0A7W7WUA4_9PSEU|nr:SSI family serine proteinase inhibitor [Saccharothrix violaceirubra]MBB4963273.1 hypothetical protein [Saccharothrix violaceirubra]